MKTLIITMVFALAIACQAEQMIVRLPVDHPEIVDELRSAGYCVCNDELPGVVDLIVDEEEYLQLLNQGYEPHYLLPYESIEGTDIDPEYHTYEELTEELQTLASQYPDICRLDSIGRATGFPRTIWSMKLSDNASIEEDEMALFYFGTHHGAEPMGCETVLYMIDHFLANYGIEPQITEWMDAYEIFFIPLVNPDGHHAVVTDYHLCWRKNARDINHNGIYYEYRGTGTWDDIMEGVDLNRNYDWYWATGGPADPRSNNYIGLAPFSERELQGIRDLGFAQRFVCGLSFHSYGEIILYPWYGNPPPDIDVFESIAQEMASCFTTDSGGTYDYGLAWGQSGQCRNWFYGVLGAVVYCVELNPTGLAICPGSQLLERNQRYMEGAIYLLDRMSGPGITGHVRDASTGNPLAANVEIVELVSPQVRPRYAEPLYGRFTRLLIPGEYTVYINKPGYQPQTIENVTVGQGMTELEIELTRVLHDPVDLHAVKEESALEVNAVNMAGRSINFEVNLPEPSGITLNVYNMLGRRIATKSIPHQAKGQGHFSVELLNAPSGIYFYSIVAGDYAGSGKMVLLK